ncbi:elongation of very long chain fatty acids protein 4-like [Daktulosphaira vitifoliae]|uniref:elongation of very long chain fatty acids protein 4-like n=1 Tax=Daktulosphaira vitifoliae TaxID=58002 RepID=UPI0021A9F9C8|nr:elongation of very long chain fatty acids protein 4-like [Daktulosphaira vitifoliae]XP_050520261.1 elongation of very long chain fatty acids protein 4-like [Daktulosphaira vitifoliae]XP_050520262.1 elongation of very long chain fatty acids protein 4-like [Daktulosphaira vitifoliae]
MANVTHKSYSNLISNAQEKFLTLLNQEIKFDEEADSWILMKTPWPILSLLVIYLLFVLKIGPQMMKKREAHNLKYAMMAYNLFQTLYNGYMISALFIPGAFQAAVDNVCHPVETDENRHIVKLFYIYSWHFVVSKISDLIDTVFFVLRKKQSHVSFLHVYHHVNMVITTWTYFRFFKGYQAVFCGLLNAFVHMVMYSYYFLSSLGPQMQKYLWWKIYITRLQIAQFLIGLTYGLHLYLFDCNFPRIFAIYMTADVLLFLYLFLIFYNKTYCKNVKAD